MTRIRLFCSTAAAVSGALATLSLGACNKPAAPAPTNSADATAASAAASAPAGALPLAEGPPPALVAQAPAAAALPPAAPAPVAAPPPAAQQYQYVDQAASLSAAFADTPPDYAVDYQGTRPWFWRARNGAYRVVEVVPGGERYYYFMPGAPTPFLVRDPSYAYAYDQGRLVVVYDAGGRPLPAALAARQSATAGRYLARARALYEAGARQAHQAAYAAVWQARRAAIAVQQQQWRQEQLQSADWRAWHDQHAAAQQAEFDRERAQRQAYAAQLAAPAAAGPRSPRGPDQRPALPRPPQGQAGMAAETRGADAARAAAQATAARQAEVNAARQDLAKAKAQVAAAGPPDRARTIDAARLRLRLALQAQAKADAASHVAAARSSAPMQRN